MLFKVGISCGINLVVPFTSNSKMQSTVIRMFWRRAFSYSTKDVYGDIIESKPKTI